MRSVALVSSAAVWGLCAHAAHADGSGPPSVGSVGGLVQINPIESETDEARFNAYDAASSVSVSDPRGSVSASALPNPTKTPAIYASGDINGGATNESVTANVSLKYSVIVLGPSASVVPVDIIYKEDMKNSGNAYVSETLTVSVEAPYIYMKDTCGNNYFRTCGDGELFSSNDQVIAFKPNVNVDIELSLSAYADNWVPGYPLYHGDASFSAWMDPYLEIDPAFLAANPGYSIEVSSGYGDSPLATPEPGCWAELLVGLFDLGACLRTRRRAAIA